MYFALKRRQLRRAMADAASRPTAWRAEPSAAGAVPSQLRARRCLPQLSLQLPVARTNLDKDAHVECECMGA